jgi:hypothetical protein
LMMQAEWRLNVDGSFMCCSIWAKLTAAQQLVWSGHWKSRWICSVMGRSLNRLGGSPSRERRTSALSAS